MPALNRSIIIRPPFPINSIQFQAPFNYKWILNRIEKSRWVDPLMVCIAFVVEVMFLRTICICTYVLCHLMQACFYCSETGNMEITSAIYPSRWFLWFSNSKSLSTKKLIWHCSLIYMIKGLGQLLELKLYESYLGLIMCILGTKKWNNFVIIRVALFFFNIVIEM